MFNKGIEHRFCVQIFTTSKEIFENFRLDDLSERLYASYTYSEHFRKLEVFLTSLFNDKLCFENFGLRNPRSRVRISPKEWNFFPNAICFETLFVTTMKVCKKVHMYKHDCFKRRKTVLHFIRSVFCCQGVDGVDDTVMVPIAVDL